MFQSTMNVYLLTEDEINMELELRYSRISGTLQQKQERLQRFLDIENQKQRREHAVAAMREDDVCYHWPVEKNQDTISTCPDCTETLYCEQGGTLVPIHQIIVELKRDVDLIKRSIMRRPGGDE